MPTFNKKEWKNRVSEYPVRRRLTMIQDEGNQFVADVSREEGTVTQAGDAFSAGNMNDLENRIEEAFENTGGGNFVGVLYHASLVDFPDVPCWEDMPAQEKAKYDASTGATVNFLDEDLPSNIIGNTDISYIGDGTLTGGLAAHEDDIDDLNSALTAETFTLTAKVGTGTAYVCYDKASKTVSVRGYVYHTSDIATSTALFTMTAGYRPSNTVRGVSESVTSSNAIVFGNAAIDSSGNIYQGGSSATRQAMIDIKYAI